MQHLIFEKKGAIGTLRINRPDALNALNREVLTELLHFITLAFAHEKLQVLIITGAGEKAFVAGADIREMEALTVEEMQEFLELGQKVNRELEKAKVITFAAVNGYALGGGLELALACDFIYADEGAKLGLPEVSLGLIPGFGGTQRLARAIGPRRAKGLILNAKTLTAAEAQAYGIVHQVCSKGEVLAVCRADAESMLKHSFEALYNAKIAIDQGFESALDQGLELEKSLCGLCFATPDRKERMTQFLNKKKQ